MGKTIALGLGNNTDYEIVWNSHIVEDLIHKYSLTMTDIKDYSEIRNERDLVVSILFFLKTGTGGERFVSDMSVIEKFASLFKMKITVGGTSPRAAIAMAKLGYESCLHLVTMNEHMRCLLPTNCEWVCSSKEDSSYPHLIIQFTAHTIIKARDIHIETDRANRIIYDNDYDNIIMKLDHHFFSDYLNDAKVLLISGFNAMHSVELLEDRIDFLRPYLIECKKRMIIFYEDACFKDIQMTRLIRDKLCELFDVYSLNEDELQAYIGENIDLLSPEAVLAALEKISLIIKTPVITIHTRYWALAYGKNAHFFKSALKGGITMATTRFRFGDDFTAEHYQHTFDLPDEKIGTEFACHINAVGGNKVCCLPSVQVTETKVTTIGLGDAFVGGFLPALI